MTTFLFSNIDVSLARTHDVLDPKMTPSQSQSPDGGESPLCPEIKLRFEILDLLVIIVVIDDPGR